MQARFRFYAELNDFLPSEKKQVEFSYEFNGKPAIKDAIEAIGVPHTEVDLILVYGKSVGFGYYLRDGDDVAVYPVFEGFDISPVIRLRPQPLRNTKFVLDVHLGKLARHLRMLGFDTCYENDLDDPEIVRISVRENRIILTRDQGLLKNSVVTHGYWLRATRPRLQLEEVLCRFDLFSQIKPFHRCTLCNGDITEVDKKKIAAQLPPRTAAYYEQFFRCTTCGRIYWKGSHFKRMSAFIASVCARNDLFKQPGNH